MRDNGIRDRLAPHLADLLALVLFLAGAGLAVHFAGLNAAPGESGSAALDLLRHGVLGDPYATPTGPTAHVSPVLGVYLAGIYDVFGPNTATARAVLGVVAAAAYALSARSAVQICSAARHAAWARWLAAALFLPLSAMLLFDDVVTDRQWDQPVAALILVLGWQVLEWGWRTARPYRPEAATAGLAGFGCLLSPAIFPTLLGSLALLIWARRRRQDSFLAALLGIVIIAACLLPWGLRNEVVLGQFIVTRSNFGLELAVGNAPGALGYSGSGSGLVLHPHDSPPAAEEMARVGELAYMRRMSGLAQHWIFTNPVRFLDLSLERARLCFLPVKAMVGWYPGLGALRAWLLLLGAGGLTLLALAVSLALRVRPITALLYVVLPLAPYVLTHVNTRYLTVTRPVEVVLVVFAAERVAGLLPRRALRPRAVQGDAR